MHQATWEPYDNIKDTKALDNYEVGEESVMGLTIPNDAGSRYDEGITYVMGILQRTAGRPTEDC